MAAPIIGKAEILAGLGGAVKLSRRNMIAHAVDPDGPIDASVGFEGLFRVNKIRGFEAPKSVWLRWLRAWVLLACKALRHLRLPQINWRSVLRTIGCSQPRTAPPATLAPKPTLKLTFHLDYSVGADHPLQRHKSRRARVLGFASAFPQPSLVGAQFVGLQSFVGERVHKG